MSSVQYVIGIVIIGIMTIFSVSFGWTSGSTNGFNQRLKQAKGEVTSYAAGIIFVEFDKPIINQCGDTDIHGFITTPANFTLQLKSVFIPKAKATEVDDKRLLFPVKDVEAFITDEGYYKVEFFVQNNCNIFNNQTVELPSIRFFSEGLNGWDN